MAIEPPISEEPEMSELAADLLVPVSTPGEADSRLGVLKVADGAPSTNGSRPWMTTSTSCLAPTVGRRSWRRRCS